MMHAQAYTHSLALVIDLCYANHLGSWEQDFDCVPWTTPMQALRWVKFMPWQIANRDCPRQQIATNTIKRFFQFCCILCGRMILKGIYLYKKIVPLRFIFLR